MKVTKSIKLEDYLFLEIERIINDDNSIEKHFYLKDEENKVRQKLAVLSDLRWSSHNPMALDKFFRIAKQYKVPITNNINKGLDFDHEISIQKRFNCFRRTFKIRVTRLTNQTTRNTRNAIQNILG
jgi:hypothetical protein